MTIIAKKKNREKCFIIMPITTPKHLVERYKGDPAHFSHVLNHLFVPALENAGFEPISPKSSGSDIIQAEIIKHLSSCDLVLCDMSILNPNVFFEFGIRTALNRSVALIVDDQTQTLPFDTSIINFYQYKSSLDVWSITTEIKDLAKHVKTAYEKTMDHNALWKYFGVAQTGVFKPEESSIGEKIDLLMKEVAGLKRQPQGALPTPFDLPKSAVKWFRAQQKNKQDYEDTQEIIRRYSWEKDAEEVEKHKP